MRDKLKELDSITDRDDFHDFHDFHDFQREASRNTNIRFDSVYSKPIVKCEDKDLFNANLHAFDHSCITDRT